ncbi:MAG: hypothetical protein P8X55_09100 [Desulfosarcinaceae bacterium]
MNALRETVQLSAELIICPYCHGTTSIIPRSDYRPIYATCDYCDKKFVIERMADSIRTYTLEEVPSCSDPHLRAIEMGQGDED